MPPQAIVTRIYSLAAVIRLEFFNTEIDLQSLDSVMREQ
jgi:hypothetical protein